MSVSRIFEIENLTQVHRRNIDITEPLRQASNLRSGTVIVRFRNSEVPSFAPLLTIVNSQYPASYFMLYSQHAYRVGIIRKIVREEGVRTEIINIYKNRQAQMNMLNTLACSIEEGVGYRLYLNGEMLSDYQDHGACFLRDIMAIAPLRAAIIGKTMESQKLEYDRAIFLGDIDFLHIYDGVLSKEALLAITAQTIPDARIYIPQGSFCSDSVALFSPGCMDTPNYRMPSLLKTKSGTLLAAADQRMHGPLEHPNKIHIVIRRSTDQGNTFEPCIPVVQMPENSCVMDSCMLQDQETGRIFLLTSQFSENSTLFSVSPGTGYELRDGVVFRQLLDDNGVKYLESPSGEITCQGKATSYATSGGYELFNNGISVGYLFSERCPLRVYPTDYLVFVYSDDDGQTWSTPQPLNPFVKEDWMTFMGCGPGRGIQLAHGAHRGRLLFPVYYVNSHGVQSSALIYSDDHGNSWKRGESCNDHRFFDGALHHSCTLIDKRLDTNEAQAVELSNGKVLLFAKSPFHESGCVAVAVSRDGGESFESALRFDPALRTTDSLSVIRLDGQVDGCDALIYAGGDSITGSSNGAVKIGLLRDSEEIDWCYSRLVKPGTFGHCSLTMITPVMLGLFYEGSGGLDLSFMRMDLPFLKTEDQPLHPVAVEGFSFEPANGGTMCTLCFNQPVMLCGDRRLKVRFTDHTASAQYHSRHADCRQYRFFIPKTKMEAVTGFSCSPRLRVFAVNGLGYTYSLRKKGFILQRSTEERTLFFSLFASHIDTFDDEKRIVSRGESWQQLLSSGVNEQEIPSGMGLRCDSEQMIQQLLQYIHMNYALPLRLSEIARNLNINAAYLGRIFSRRMNQSFGSYLAAYRIARARELLKNDGLMIYEIAQMVGYNDINHFYRVFKKHNHVTPTAYRKKQQW